MEKCTLKNGEPVMIKSGIYDRMIGGFVNYDPDDPSRCIIVINDLTLKESVDNITTDDYFLKQGDPVMITAGDYIGKKGTIVTYDPDTFNVSVKIGNTIIIDKPRDFVRYDSSDKDKEIPIICICGSMKLYNEMISVAEEKTREGALVLLPFKNYITDGIPSDIMTDEEADECWKIHRKRISMADSILIVTNGIYLDPNTEKNINYAKALGKPVEFYKCYM